MTISLLIGIACAVLFFRAADYERMSPWAWAVASLGLTVIVVYVTGRLALVLLAQLALFVVMTWYNGRRQRKH